MPTEFDLRYKLYTPGGAVITSPVTVAALDSTITIPYGDAPTINIPVSEVISSTLPDYIELAVEYYSGTVWVEPTGCRFLINGRSVDATDATKTNTLTGVGLWWWLLNKSYLNHVASYSVTGAASIITYTPSGITSSGSTLTLTSHGFIVGDEIQVTNKGGSTGLQTNGTYWVTAATTNTFQISGTFGGAARVIGTHSGIAVTRFKNRVVKSGHLFVNGEKVLVTATGGADGITAKQSYYIVNRTSTTFGLASQVNGAPIHVGTVAGMDLRAAPDGDRRFNAATPGTILKTLIDESQARGALYGAMSGPLTYDFSATLDSNGHAWASTYTIGFAPGTTGLSLLQTLLQNNWVEVSTNGRVLHAYNTGSGTDYSTGASPKSIGITATSRPLTVSLDNMVTAVLTVDENGKERGSYAGVVVPLGQLEQYQTQAGISDDGTSAAIVTNYGMNNTAPNQQWTVTELASTAAVWPFRDYQPGDKVRFRAKDAWQAANVSQLQLRTDSSGQVTFDTILGHRFIDPANRLTYRFMNLSGGKQDSGTGGTIIPWVNNLQPAAPTAPTIATTGTFVGTGLAKSGVAISWTAVTDDGVGNAVNVTDYEVWTRADGNPQPVLAGRTGGALSLNVPGLDPNSLAYVSVRAITASGQQGVLSAETELTGAAPTDILDAPSVPAVTSNGAQINIDWDGNLTTGAPPAQFWHFIARTSASSGGTYVDVAQNLSVAGTLIIPNQTVGNTVWVKTYAVDSLGVESAGTAPQSVVVGGVDIPALTPNTQSYLVAVGTLTEGLWRTAPSGYLLADGTAASRTTYAALFAVIAPVIGTCTMTVSSPGQVTRTAHGLNPGDSVFFTTTGALLTGLTANTNYIVKTVTTNTFTVSATVGGAAVNFTGTQSGVHTLTFCPFGPGNGSTTFDLPNLSGRVTVSPYIAGTTFLAMGQLGGNMVNPTQHRHTLTNASAEIFVGTTAIVGALQTTASWTATRSATITGSTISSGFTTGSPLTGLVDGNDLTDPLTSLMPFIVVNRAIKF